MDTHHYHGPLKCAPGRRGEGTTCFNLVELRGIASAWNDNLLQAHGRAGGALADTSKGATCLRTAIDLTKHPTAPVLWREIQSRMVASTTCRNRERCWLRHMRTAAEQSSHSENRDSALRLLDSIDRTAFRPTMPASWTKNPNDWLSTTDIERVLKQYEQHDPHFRFVGAVPIDFASPRDDGAMGKCITQALCKVDVGEWLNKRNHRRVGIVFNLDAHDQPGSHWVSAYLDLVGNAMAYYDSFGGQIPPEVQRLFTAVGTQLEQHHGDPPQVCHNTMRHQFRNTECGVYSILFLASMIEAAKRNHSAPDSFDDFVHRAFTDRQVEKCRSHFFDNSENATALRLDDHYSVPYHKGWVGGGCRTARTSGVPRLSRARQHRHSKRKTRNQGRVHQKKGTKCARRSTRTRVHEV